MYLNPGIMPPQPTILGENRGTRGSSVPVVGWERVIRRAATHRDPCSPEIRAVMPDGLVVVEVGIEECRAANEKNSFLISAAGGFRVLGNGGA